MEMNSYELFKEIRLGDEHIKLFFIDCGNGLCLKNINIIMQIKW